MENFSAFRKSAFAYWERRRWVYNGLLVPPSLLGWAASREVPMALGDEFFLGIGLTAVLFLIAAAGANLCFSFCYTLEFYFAGTRWSGAWTRTWRPLVFALGCFIGMIGALIGGADIANIRRS